jgi:hypothetical protein
LTKLAKVGTAKACSATAQRIEINVVRQRLAFDVHA